MFLQQNVTSQTEGLSELIYKMGDLKIKCHVKDYIQFYCNCMLIAKHDFYTNIMCPKYMVVVNCIF